MCEFQQLSVEGLEPDDADRPSRFRLTGLVESDCSGVQVKISHQGEEISFAQVNFEEEAIALNGQNWFQLSYQFPNNEFIECGDALSVFLECLEDSNCRTLDVIEVVCKKQPEEPNPEEPVDPGIRIIGGGGRRWDWGDWSIDLSLCGALNLLLRIGITGALTFA